MSNTSIGLNQDSIRMMGGQLGQYPSVPTVDQAIATLRKRANELRTNLASVEAWGAELAKLEAVLTAWGDK